LKNLFSFFLVLLLFSCGDTTLEDLIVSDGLPETTLSDIETTFSDSTISIDWEGNEFALSFSYRLESLSYSSYGLNRYSDWSEWDSLKSVTLTYLDDGDYIFYLKSRYTTDIEETVKSTEFTVDAIEGPALRIYPLYQQVKTGESFDLYIFAEDVVDFAGMELNLSYNSTLFTFNSLSQGTPLLNTSFFIDETSTSDGIGTIEIIAIALSEDFNSITGNTSLVKLTLGANQISQEDVLTINSSSVLRDQNNDPIEINSFINGIIEVVQ